MASNKAAILVWLALPKHTQKKDSTMDEYRDTTLHNADGTEDALRADMNDNAAPETADAAETEILSAVADIEPEGNDADACETKDGTGSVRHRRPHRRRNIIIASVIAAVVVLAAVVGDDRSLHPCGGARGDGTQP